MTLRDHCENRTICEVLRLINDNLQGEEVHKKVLPLLIEAEQMGKRIVRKLVEYNKDAMNEWWEKNPEYEKKIKMRLSKNYITKVEQYE